MKRQILAFAAAGAVLFAACGSDSSSTPATDAPGTSATDTTVGGTDTTGGDAKACAQGKTLDAATLTIATGDPAFPPYVIDDKPESGKGFESALALAVAKQLGFEGDAVKWVRTSFDTAVAGDDKTFDFNLQQFTINPDRQKVVSFSDPYYTANQALIGATDGPAKDVKSIADLKSLKLGAAAGTTSLQYINDVIKPTAEAFEFNSNADAATALDNGQIDAIISDLPTAIFWAAAGTANGGIDNTKVFGQFPLGDQGGDQWGLLLAKDNPLVECTNIALANLTASGDLEKITTEWMSNYTEAPTLPES
jgi:polar amino acid transport system substrate-binding protein